MKKFNRFPVTVPVVIVLISLIDIVMTLFSIAVAIILYPIKETREFASGELSAGNAYAKRKAYENILSKMTEDVENLNRRDGEGKH